MLASALVVSDREYSDSARQQTRGIDIRRETILVHDKWQVEKEEASNRSIERMDSLKDLAALT